MTGFQIPRNSLAWLLVAQVAVIAPHVQRLPIWVVCVCVACILWRVMVYQGRWRYPGRWTLVAFVVGGFVGVPIGFGTVLGLEPAVALLIIAYVLKLLEMHHKRDAYVVVLLGYFVAMTQFLFFQSIPWTSFILLAILILTAGLVGLNQTTTHARPFVTFRTGAILTAQALPLMLVLFVLFPRLPPLWSVPMPSQVARSGISDVVSPGDIASLANSSELAFKATFSGDPPPFSAMYWRGMVLTEFDGRAWRQEELTWRRGTFWRYRQNEPDWLDTIERIGNPFSYSIIMEPTQQNWMFSLTIPMLPEDRDIVMARDYRLARIEPVRTKIRYDLTSHLAYRLEANLDDFWRYRMTLLPDEGNPRARELAKTLFAASSGTEDFVARVLRRYFTEGFSYTLNPQLLGEDSIDEFLFETRGGFCEHFASSFAFLMRAAGVPARVVVGYQGGEYNDIADYVAVYQYDAHAWVEVWVEEKGWIRVDPTTAVAPDRIQRGLAAAVASERTFLANSPFSAFARQTLWLAEIRLQISAISYYWDSWVVGYTPEAQNDLISRYLGDVDRKELGMIMLATFFGLLAMIGLLLLLKRPHRMLAPVEREYLKFCHVMARQGLARATGEGPLDFARRVAAARPELADHIWAVTNAFVAQNYVATEPGSDLSVLRQAVRGLRLKALG